MKLDETRIAELTANIRRVRANCSPDQVAAGASWYVKAHELAREIGKGDVRKGAGIIAALSPRMRWERNVKLAIDAGNGHVHGAMSCSLRKAQAIVDGADPIDVLPMSAKTGNFYTNIVDPCEPDAVTVDVWAHRVATGDRSSSGPRNARDYAECMFAYQNVAREYDEPGNHTQAGCWEYVRQGGAL